MRKKLLKFLALSLAFVLCVPTAGAARRGEEMVRVGLAYGSGALVGANLENNTGYGSGYRFGYFDEDLRFEELGETDEKETQITVLKAQNTWFYYDRSSGKYIYSNSDNGGTVVGCFHLLIDSFRRFDDAAEEAEEYDGGFVAWIDGEYQVRVGAYLSKEDALDAADELGEGEVVGTSAYAVTVIQTGTDRVLFQFDGGEDLALGIMPDVTGEDEVRTWFQGYKYHGGFRYERIGGGDLTVVSVVDMETYIKGVIPFEMSNDWPLEALKAQAVCARTFACLNSKHLSAYGFDVCTSTDCQVYNGVGNATSATDRAVEETEGECLYYDGELAEAYYHSSDGGATEDAENVWGTDVPYLRGKEDPYEAQISIPDYRWTVTYTWEELTWVLQNSGYDIGDVVDAYVSEVTDLGNVYSVTFVDSRGKTLVRTGDDARMAFYSTTLGKNVPSLRFTITGGTGGGSSYAVNSASGTLSALDGASVISGSGTVSRLEGEDHAAISASGTADLTGGSSGGRGSASRGGITITGTGNGHNVGMSQYGARAMAEQGHDYIDILEFYFTGIRVR